MNSSLSDSRRPPPAASRRVQPCHPLAEQARIRGAGGVGITAAYFIEREIEAGRIKSYAGVAGRLGISRARVSQIADTVLLPVAVQEAILEGEVRLSETDLRKVLW